jgi:2'-5' RNA ligase
MEMVPTKRDNDLKRARMMIERYKAPYILQRFYPHFTLLTQLPQNKSLQINKELKELFSKEVGNPVLRVNKLALMTRLSPESPWVIKEEICLGT